MRSNNDYIVDIKGYSASLPILELPSGIKIAFFNLHGDVALTEHSAYHLAKCLEGAEVILTAESKGLQLAHCVAKNLLHTRYAVARKAHKLYMKDFISVTVQSITTKGEQTLYLSEADACLLKGKKVAIVDDVISSGGSLSGMETLVEKCGGILFKKGFVLAEGQAKFRKDIVFLADIPLL